MVQPAIRHRSACRREAARIDVILHFLFLVATGDARGVKAAEGTMPARQVAAHRAVIAIHGARPGYNYTRARRWRRAGERGANSIQFGSDLEIEELLEPKAAARGALLHGRVGVFDEMGFEEVALLLRSES